MHLPDDLPPPATERLRVMQEVRLGLLAVAERLRQNWAAHAAAAGLSTAQVNALLSLRPGEAVPMRSLAARLDYDASNLSVLVDRLERRGAVERRPDPGDRRVKALALTPDGERLRASFWRELLEDAGPLAPLADSDLEELAALLGLVSPVQGAAGVASSAAPGRG